MQIKTKAEMYSLQRKMLLGNCLRTWPNINAVWAEGFVGQVGIRHTDKSGGKMANFANVAASEMAEWLEKHGVKDNYIVQEGAPDEWLICQGELMRGVAGLELRISFKKCKMREAMAGETLRLTGLVAKAFLHAVTTPSSYDMLMELLDEYDGGPLVGAPNRDTVIEWGAYQMPLGSGKQQNVLVWECRSY